MSRLTGGLMKDLLGIHTPDEVEAVEAETNSTNDAAEELDENGLPGQSIIDLVENTDSLKKDDEPRAEEPKAPKEEPKPVKAEDSKEETVPPEDDDTDYFEDIDSKKEEESESKATEVIERQAVNQVIADSYKIRTTEGDGDMSKGTTNIADLMIRFDHEKLTASVAELLASDGKVINPKLLEIVEFAIDKNPETRKSISEKIPEFIREFPDNIKTYQASVFEVARNIRVKYMLRCPENGNLYESMEGFFEKMEVENPHLAIEYGRGLRKLQEVWIKTDCDGNIIDQDKLLTEAEVRKIVLGLPKEIQDEACEKLHIPKMIVKKKTGDKKPEDKK